MNKQMPSDSSAASPLSISVIMPVYNGCAFIDKSLPPLVAMLESAEVLEVLVVDDSSSDKSIEMAERLGARVIPSGGRLGAGGARNVAAKLAQGELLWFVDADVVVHRDAARVLLSGFEEQQVVGVFGSYDDEPAAQNFLSQYKNLAHHFYHHKARREASSFWSGCGAIRAHAFREQGGFDVVMFTRPSVEDIELGYRLKAAGGRLLLLNNLLCKHLKEWRFVNLIHTEIFCRALPWSRLMIRRGGLDADLNVGLGERLRAIASALFFLGVALAPLGKPFWIAALALSALMIFANHAIFGLFVRRKGLCFGIGGLLFHQIYYVYSSMAFVWAMFEIRVLRRGV
jgi:glycosyltransferase involved in cell wall biosynthesis